MQMLGTWLVTFQAIRLDGGRCFKGVHLSQVHQQSYQVPNKTVKCTYFLSVVNIPTWMVHLRQVHPLKKALRNRNKKAAGHVVMSSGLYINIYKAAKLAFQGVHLSQVHQPRNIEVPLALLVHLRQVHPLKVTLAWLVHFLLWQAAKPSGDKCTP